MATGSSSPKGGMLTISFSIPVVFVVEVFASSISDERSFCVLLLLSCESSAVCSDSILLSCNGYGYD